MNNSKDKALILMYHGIAKVSSDPWEIFVSPENFEEQVKTFSSQFTIISLSDFIKNDFQLSQPSAVITFDDGYANNFYNAMPILEKYNAPATFFITTQNLGTDREYWWDQLEHIFYSESRLPAELNIKIGSDDFCFILDGEDNSPGINESRLSALKKIRKKMMSLSIEQKDRLISHLLEWANITKESRPTHRALSTSELRELADNNLFEIGCHTYSHPVLSKLDSKSQDYEIGHSKAQLQEILDKPISGFSYPFGKENHYDQDTLNIVKGCGFDYACTSVEQSVSKSANVFELPRVFVKNWNAEEFSKNIASYLS